MNNTRMTCSTCGKRFDPTQSPAPPFCSRRCQQIDLGRWLSEDVQLPHEGGSDSAEGFSVDQDGYVSDDRGDDWR
jgi:endogenous inhibitor of DNA gyrase (YacG/DUF329 family)